MQYNVAQLLKEPTGSTRSYSLAVDFSEADRFAEEVTGEVSLLRTHQGLLVRAALEARVRYSCGRCLVDFTAPSSIDLEEEFFPRVDVQTGQKVAPPEDAEGELIGADHVLDLTETVRQCLIAAQPMKPLCRAGCGGLCSECGTRLDEEKCNCGDGQVDPRWGALAALLTESQGT